MLMKRGDCDDAADDLKKCMLCGKCLLVCPRGVDTRKMILAMVEFYRQKEKKINEGYVLR
jgi:heterodisulfide reductase subunit B